MNGNYLRVSNDSDEDVVELQLVAQQTKVNGRVSFYQNNPINFWNTECICRLISLFILFLIAIGFGISRFPVHSFHSHNHAEEHHLFKHAAVAAGQKECSDIGKEVLKDGGNAVDAAIATLLCQGVVEPYFCGIGGGFFMTIYNQSTKSSTIIDARETAPSNATWDMFDTHSSTSGGLSVAVPGELKGYSYAYKKYGGGVPWSRLFVPAIEKARNGFAVSSEFATKLQEDKSSILKHSGLCDLYCNQARDEVKSEGEIVKNAKLADTLETVKNHGAEAFYTSPLVDAFVHDINFNGGEVSAADFANYKVKERTPLKVALANSGLTLIVPPLPSGGPILSIIMLVMDSYNINPQLFKSNNSLYWHRTVESFKHAFGHATHFGDPDFARNANQAVIDTLSQSGILNITRKVLDDRTFTDTIYYGAAEHNSNTHTSSTSHLSVLSPDGDAVSVTSTINYHFGSFVFSSSTGVLFNNEMGDFTAPGMGANMVEAGKRPQSSMSPCVLVDSTTNEVVYIFGAAGGKHIPTAVAISLLELLYFGTSDFDEAIRQPRLHNQLFPDVINYEADFKESVLDDLRALGHNVADEPQGHRSSVNGIKNHGSHIHAFSDLRNKGSGASGW